MTDHILRIRVASRLILCLAAANLLAQANRVGADGPSPTWPGPVVVEAQPLSPGLFGPPPTPPQAPTMLGPVCQMAPAIDEVDGGRRPLIASPAHEEVLKGGTADVVSVRLANRIAPSGPADAARVDILPPRSLPSPQSFQPFVPAQVLPSLPAPAPLAIQAPAPPLAAAPDRQLEAVCAQADVHVRRGFEMAGRGALFTGRSEFIEALRLIAENADATEGDSVHSNALAAGLRAMEEAQSFVPRGSHLEAELDMDVIIASHRTPVLHNLLDEPNRAHRPSPLEALGRYLSYAQKQLTVAACGLPAGAMALYGLGKIHTAMVAADADCRHLEEPRAIALHQAALSVDPSCALAANELGVLLARYHRYEEARGWLQRSASLASRPETWHNLAVVHARLGEEDLARRAEQQGAIVQSQTPPDLAPSHPALARGPVRWLTPAQFAQVRTADTSLQPVPEKTAAIAQPAPPLPSPSASGGLASWLPWTTKR